MSLPRGDEYVAAIQHPRIAFGDPGSRYGDRDLERCDVAKSPNGIPIPLSGGFTMTFHCAGSGDWAVRCFTLEVRELKQRYDAITQFLRSNSDRLFTPAELVPQGILIKGTRYDIIKMGWVAGEQLNSFVNKSALDAAMMRRLGENVMTMGMRLAALQMAHGDLQHGNILVDPNGEMRLVDYDDMFLPALASLSYSSGLGHRNFQHPDRSSSNFGPTMDRFSLFSMYLTFLALTEQPALWRTYGGGDERLLFTRDDYLNPESSPLFQDLSRLGCSAWVDKFAAVCRGSYGSIPSLSDFIDGRFAYSRFDAKTVRVTPSPSISAFAATFSGTQPASPGPAHTPQGSVPLGFAQSIFAQPASARPPLAPIQQQAAPGVYQPLPTMSSSLPPRKWNRWPATIIGVALFWGIASHWGAVRQIFAPQAHAHPTANQAPRPVASAGTPLAASANFPNEAWFGGKPVSAILKSTSALSVTTPGANMSWCTGLDVTVSGYGGGCVDPTRPEIGAEGDGTQLMIIPIESGGSGGVFSALLYELANASPNFLGVLPGDGSGHLSATIDDGYIVEQWQQQGGPECCPTALIRQRSLVRNGRVVKLDKTTVAVAGANQNTNVVTTPKAAQPRSADRAETSYPAASEPAVTSTPEPQNTINTGTASTTNEVQCTDPDTAARVDQQAKPVAPASAFGAAPGTVVQVTVSLDADGRETDATIQTPNISPALTSATLDVVRASGYIAATHHCQGAASAVMMTVTF